MITLNEILDLVKEKSGILDLNNDKAFNQLAALIESETGVKAPNINTLKRVFNHLNTREGYMPSKPTLNFIAKYFGCDTWEELEQSIDYIRSRNKKVSGPKGGFFNDRQMELVVENMKPGTSITIEYAKNSRITVECIGKYEFKVIGAKNSDLMLNDRFYASNFIKGDEFRVSKVVRDNRYLGNYKAPEYQTITEVSKPKRINLNNILNFQTAA